MEDVYHRAPVCGACRARLYFWFLLDYSEYVVWSSHSSTQPTNPEVFDIFCFPRVVSAVLALWSVPSVCEHRDCRELIGGVRVLGHSRAIADTSALGGEEAEGMAGPEANEELAAGATSSTGVVASAGVERSSGSPLVGPAEAVAARLAADRLFERTIKFVGTVGVSILRLRGPDAPFSLLCLKDAAHVAGGAYADAADAGGGTFSTTVGMGVPNTRVVYGSLELENVTKALPLNYRVTAGDGSSSSKTCDDVGSMDKAGILRRLEGLPAGSAELVVLTEGTGTMPPASRRRLRFCLLLHAFQGVFERKITVENTSSSGRTNGASTGVTVSPSLSHLVRLFVDDGAISLITSPSEDNTAVPVLPPSRPRISSGSVVDVADAVVAFGHEQPAQHEECLVDENGNALPSLDTLSIPFTVNVTQQACASSALASSEDSPAATAGEENGQGSVLAAHSRFCTLPVVGRGGTAYGDLGKVHEIIGSADADEQRGWAGAERFEISSPDGFRRGVADDRRRQEDEAPGGLVFRLTNTLHRAVVLGPYSNLPLVVEAVGVDNELADDEEEPVGLFELESAGSVREDDGRTMGLGSIGDGEDTPEDDVLSSVSLIVRKEEQQQVRRGSLSRCGPAMSLAARSTAIVRLSIQTGALTEPLPTTAMESGQAVSFDGIIAFARISDASSTRQDVGVVGRRGGIRESGAVPEVVDFSDTTVAHSSTVGPPLAKLLRAVGKYCWPRFEIVGPAVVDLGNVGHTASRRGRRRFVVRLRSLCDTPIPVCVVVSSRELEVVTEGDESEVPGAGFVDKVVVPRRKTGHYRSRSSTGGGGGGGNSEAIARSDSSPAGGGVISGCARARAAERERTHVLWIPAREEMTVVFQLRLSRRRQSWAGLQTFGICLANLADPSAKAIDIPVFAHVVTQLVSIIGLDEVPPSPVLLRLLSPGTPTCSGPSITRRTRSSSLEGFGAFGTPERGSVRLEPLAIPPARGAAGRCTGSFQIKNVSGDAVSVMLRVAPAAEVVGVLSLNAYVQQQDSSTGVYASAGPDDRPSQSVALLPGDLLDVNAECLAQPGARLPPELLPLPPAASEIAMTMQGGSRSARPDWGQQVRLMGTVRVEIALEGRSGDRDGLADAGVGQGEGVLIESVALVGSLVPGPTFGLSNTSVTVALRPPESGGGGGGGHGDVTHPYDPEGPASFFVQSFSQSLGPVRFKVEGGGWLHLARGVRVPAAEDEGGGRRRPARVVKVVTAVAEPSRGTVSANGRREVSVRLVAADQEETDGALGGEDGGGGAEHVRRRSGGDGGDSGVVGDGEGQDRRAMFVSITDADHPGYPPQVVMIHVDVPTVISECQHPPAGLLGVGLTGMTRGIIDGSMGTMAVRERDPGRSYGMSNGHVGDVSAGIAAKDAIGKMTRLSRSR